MLCFRKDEAEAECWAHLFAELQTHCMLKRTKGTTMETIGAPKFSHRRIDEEAAKAEASKAQLLKLQPGP